LLDCILSKNIQSRAKSAREFRPAETNPAQSWKMLMLMSRVAN
jgi:hypothetical protein